MKSLKYFLTALCLVAVVFAVCACDIPSNGVVGLDGIGNMLKTTTSKQNSSLTPRKAA